MKEEEQGGEEAAAAATTTAEPPSSTASTMEINEGGDGPNSGHLLLIQSPLRDFWNI